MSTAADAERGRLACEQLRWRDGHELLTVADAANPLELEELEWLALRAI